MCFSAWISIHCHWLLTITLQIQYSILWGVYTVYYRFYEDGSGTNPVKCVYVECDHNTCIFKSPVTNNELPIATSSNVLYSDNHCKVNFVEIIHDCIPRRVDLKLQFASYGNKVYLQVWFIYVLNWYNCHAVKDIIINMFKLYGVILCYTASNVVI